MTQPPQQPQQWWQPPNSPGSPQNPQGPQSHPNPQPNRWPPAGQQQGQPPWQPPLASPYPVAGNGNQPPHGFDSQPTSYGGLGAFGGNTPQPGRSKKPLIFGGVGVLALAAAAGIAWLLGAFSGDTLDQRSTQEGVTKVLTDSYGEHDIKDTQCPAGEEITAGKTFDCTVVLAGQAKKVTIRILNDTPEFVVGAPH